MADDEETLFRAVVSDVFDLSPRLVYADWLEERGDPRAEFIRIQCDPEGVAVELGNASWREELAARERALLTAHRRRWDGAIHRRLNREFPDGAMSGRRGIINGWAYRRGFVEAVSIQINPFTFDGNLLDLIGPIRYMRFPMRHFDGDRWGGERPRAITGRLIRELAASPRLEGVEILDLHANGLVDADAKTLANSPHLKRLTVLDISENDLTEAGVQALKTSRNLPGLKTLHDVHNRHNRTLGHYRNERRGGPFPWLAGSGPPSGRFPDRGYRKPDA